MRWTAQWLREGTGRCYTKGCTGEFDCGTVLYSGHTGLSIKTHRSVYQKRLKSKFFKR